MGQKMHEKDEHNRENKQIEEGGRDDDKNKIEADDDEKKDQMKKRKAKFDADKKESQKAHKKHKKSKDVVEVKDISVKTSLGGKENSEEESSKVMNLENNEEAERVRKGKCKKKNRDGIDAVGMGTETLECSKTQELVENKDGEYGLIFGKRFSKEEDDIILKAVDEFIDNHNLGDEGINIVLNCKDHKEARNCWKEIQKALPRRPVDSVYHRAHVLLERDDGKKHQWTPEELETVRNFVEKHGPKWKLLAESLGKYRHHVKDAWRRTKLTDRNKGRWNQDEYQSLFDLVNMDLAMKVNEERISKHGMLRDNICWTAISDKMQTRNFPSCCNKWYNQLTSPMVAEGIWADVDDYRMLDALSSFDACCMEDVDWDNLIDNRSGDICRKRWGQMVYQLAPKKDMSFSEQVDVLAERYRPDMVEAREIHDSKVPIDIP